MSMAGWMLIMIGLGVGMVGGFFLACALGMAKESDRQAEVDYLKMKLADKKNA